jgi:hypothetical protein
MARGPCLAAAKREPWRRPGLIQRKPQGVLSMKSDVFERLRHSQFAEPIWQPVIFAILLVLIFVMLVLISRT